MSLFPIIQAKLLRTYQNYLFHFDSTNIRRQQLNYQIFFEVFLNYFHFPSVYGASQGLQMQ